MNGNNAHKRKHQEKQDRPQKKLKLIKHDELLPSLAELNDDVLDHIITNFLGASSLLNLAMTCSKFGIIINSQYKIIMRRIFPCRLDMNDEVRKQCHNQLKDIARIEKAFGNIYNVRIAEIDGDCEEYHQIIPRTEFKTFPADPSKVLCLTHGNTVVQLIDFKLGTIHTTDMGGKVHDMDISPNLNAAFLLHSGVLQVYSIANPAHWTKVFAAETKLVGEREAKVKWMSKHGYWIAYHQMGSSYRVYDEAGKLAKKVHYDDDYWRVLAVADDGSDAVRLVFKPYEDNDNTLNRVDLLTNKSTTLLEDTGQSGDELADLKFLPGSDWVAWRRTGTEMFAQFMYNLKTGERYWTPTSAGPRLSYGGTMLMESKSLSAAIQLHDLYSDKEFQIELDNVMHQEWTYLPHNGDLNERIVGSVTEEDGSSSICILSPTPGAKVTKVFNLKEVKQNIIDLSNLPSHWELAHVLAQGRTLVLRDAFHRCGYFMVWNLY
jgi:hypothetical protein